MKKPSSPKFPATRWSLLLTFQTGQEELATRALSELCTTYWYPVYAHVRRHQHSAQDAEDITQSFFYHLISKNTLQRVTHNGGKLRSFLLKSLDYFIASSARHDRALKRGGGQVLVPIDHVEAEGRYQQEMHDSDDPERLYERSWALTLVQEVLNSLSEEFSAKGKSAQFEVFRDLLLGANDVSHQDLAAILGISESGARVALFRTRQRYGELLREAIAETVATAAEVDEEIAHIIRILRKS